MIRLIVAAIMAAATIASNASLSRAQSAPTSPAATAAAVASGVPLHVLAAQGNPNVTVERVDLPAAACSALLVHVPSSNLERAKTEQCSMIHYNFHANHLPISVGTDGVSAKMSTNTTAADGICCGFWHFTNDDELTDITNGNVWSANEWEDGVANGTNVYNWHNQCTPGGLGVAINSCFVNFNGGGTPYYGLQYAMDICTGLTTSWVSFCFHHGQRRWIDDWGDPSTYYYW